MGRDWKGGKEGDWSQGPVEVAYKRIPRFTTSSALCEFAELRHQVVVPFEVSRFVDGKPGLDPPGAFTRSGGSSPLLSETFRHLMRYRHEQSRGE